MVVGGAVGGLAGLGAYAYTHQDSFQWGEAAVWAGGGALAGSGVGLVGEAIGAAGAVTVTTMAAPAAQRASVWALGPGERGLAIESAVGRSPNLVANFPVIDRFQNGIATSIKSIDLSARTYQNVANLTRTVTGYINTMKDYQGQATYWGGVRILPQQITGRVVDLVIPANGATQEQLDALAELSRYAQSVNVTLNVIRMP